MKEGKDKAAPLLPLLLPAADPAAYALMSTRARLELGSSIPLLPVV